MTKCKLYPQIESVIFDREAECMLFQLLKKLNLDMKRSRISVNPM